MIPRFLVWRAKWMKVVIIKTGNKVWVCEGIDVGRENNGKKDDEF